MLVSDNNPTASTLCSFVFFLWLSLLSAGRIYHVCLFMAGKKSTLLKDRRSLKDMRAFQKINTMMMLSFRTLTHA
jgi:hypothetical protein